MMNKRICLFIVLLLLFIPSYNVKAKSIQDFKNELASLEKKYKEATDKKNLTSSEIKALTDEINTITANINSIKSDIRKAESDIINSQNEIEEKRNETDELLKFLQVTSGENVYLEYIFEAESYTDFIYRYSVVSQLTEHNETLMRELETLVTELETKKEEFSKKQKELENSSSTLNSKIATLRINLEGYKEEGTTIEEDIADMKKQIKKYQDMGCSNNEDVTSCVTRINNANKGGTVSINAKGWSYPLAWGCVTSEYTGYAIRDDWSGGGSHHGIDLDCVSEGTKVYAAANGVVARIVYRSSCGGNMVWVYHNVNGTPYTSVYMHLLTISVSENQVVTPQTVIGGVGGGSTASYDNCTGGAHLHFGIAYGHNAFSFNGHSFNPRNIINFPALYYNGGGYFSR